ncbi:sugar ABC transporter permease [Bacillus aquiflavi]|uniref:Sugar ABC transporter permease n=1 Tax=Bacillus aquiflavi TaxID=2672567 RepID=A0A6B3VVM6_9BACI|nr:sugar ABC transporter permease [Bacillus aquiflavi]MBA4537833.1 sugar ABC transporter permease [Bacillus aquiflavi]NEY82089.1 sugar ABC transporter permease [Bacillus aquiflavi]
MRGMKPNYQITPWLLLLPSLIFIIIFTFYPILKTIYLSLFQADLTTPEPYFVGLDNFSRMMEDKVFWKALKNNILFAAGTVPLSMALGLAMALLVNRALKGSGLVKTLLFYPVVIPMIAAANIWLFIYTPEYGMLNQILSLFGAGSINVLGHTETVLPAMIFMVVWKEAGFFMVFYLAGLQNISKELYEASIIDGASKWQQFWKVTFPLLMPTTLFIFIIATTNAFKLVDHLVVMTQGGPDNASNLLFYYIYENAFKFLDYGMASTLTIVMLVVMLVIAAVQFFTVDKKIHYN